METATLAGGCFWCTEAIFKRLKGVSAVTPGYTGGNIPNPTYEQVSTGTTDHAEAIQIEFDPNTISYTQLLEIFFHLHDPTTLNQQGADTGTQYRSAIFYHNQYQKQIAEEIKTKIENSGTYHNSLVTQIVPAAQFYPAEKYHLDYYEKNSSAPYCRIVINPKIQKLLENYKPLVK